MSSPSLNLQNFKSQIFNKYFSITFELSFQTVNFKAWSTLELQLAIELLYNLKDEFDGMEIYVDIICSREVSKLCEF